MGNVANAFTSGLQGAPVGGTTDATGAATAGVSPASADAFGGFGNFNDIVNALSGGSGGAPPIVSNAVAQAPASVDASSGTQSNVSPGGRNAPEQNQQQQQEPPDQGQQAPPQAIDQLRDLLNKAVGKPTGPTFIQPKLTPGQTGPQSPTQTTPEVLRRAMNALIGSQPAPARTPPPDQVGREITVQPKPAPAPAPPATTPPVDPSSPEMNANPPLTPAQPPPVTPPAAPISPAQAYPQHTSQIQRDLAGLPRSLPQLALDLAGVLGPLAIAFGKGGRPGVDYAGGYGEALDMLHPPGADEAKGHADAAALSLQDKNGNPSPTGAFDRNGAFVASPDKTPVSNQIPGVTPIIVDNYVRDGARKRGMDPDIASKMVGAESGYGQNNLGDYVNGQPTSFGPLQLHHAADGKAMGDQFQHDTGQRPEDFAQNWKQQVDYALDKAAKEGWGPWQTSMKKLGLSQWSGINRPPPPVTIRPEGTNPKVSFLTSAVS